MFIQFRLTPEYAQNSDKYWISRFRKDFMDYLRNLGTIQHYASVWEDRNKFGEETKKHLHLNIEFYEDELLKKDTMMTWIRRHQLGIKGNKCYCLKIVGDPKDEKRWWRYLVKQNDLNKNHHLPEDFDIALETKCARDEREQQILKNIQSRDKLLKKDSFRLRIFNLMLARNSDLTALTDKYLWCEFVKMYQEDNRIPPFSTMDNLVLDFKCHTKIITPEEYFDQTHR